MMACKVIPPKSFKISYEADTVIVKFTQYTPIETLNIIFMNSADDFKLITNNIEFDNHNKIMIFN